MPSIETWQGSSFALSSWRDDVLRAGDTARTVSDKTASIIITRAGAQLDAQTVRLEPTGGAGESGGPAGTVSNAGILVTGYKDHATITDTNIRRGDRFFYDGQMYTVTQVLPDVPDRILAVGEASE
jgi:hypothetical protein